MNDATTRLLVARSSQPDRDCADYEGTTAVELHIPAACTSGSNTSVAAGSAPGYIKRRRPQPIRPRTRWPTHRPTRSRRPRAEPWTTWRKPQWDEADPTTANNTAMATVAGGTLAGPPWTALGLAAMPPAGSRRCVHVDPASLTTIAWRST